MASWFQQDPASPWPHGWTTSAGPDFGSAATSDEHQIAVEALVAEAGLSGGAWVHQVHGGQVLRATQPGYVGEADALWTTERGLGIIGRSADCPLILISGSDSTGKGYWGFAHASWRSTVENITLSLLSEMIVAGMSADLTHALVCPSAGPCCYEVGPEVYQAAVEKLGLASAQHFPQKGAGQTYDLWSANGAQLKAGGIPRANISIVGVCTICTGLQYPSHRREKGRAGRMAAIVGGAL